MKKVLAVILAAVMVFSMTACGGGKEETKAPETTAAPATEAATTAAPTEAPTEAAAEGVMTHAEYEAAELDSEVTIETYVQATQSWWDGKITMYTQAEDGAYFIYNAACESQAEADKLVPGTKIRVNGFKSEWSGEVEIVDATYEIIDGNFIAEPLYASDLLGTDELIKHQNEKVEFGQMTVEPANDEGAAFLYKWDGSGQDGDDIYFNVSYNGQIYTFTVESYLCPAGSDCYEFIKTITVGETINVEGFLYWYEGPQPHITALNFEIPEVKSEGVMTYDEYAAAAVDDPVTIEAYVQATQSWWDGKITIYAQDKDGAYFIYNAACESQEEADKLVPGTKIKVTGYKSEWSGEVEIVDATYELGDGFYVAPAKTIDEVYGTVDMINYMNQKVAFTGLKVEDKGEGAAFLYKWDGSGQDGDDLYFDVTGGDTTYSFTVESYLTGAGTDVYEAVKALQPGQTVNVEGFLYWYEGPQMHVTAVTVAE